MSDDLATMTMPSFRSSADLVGLTVDAKPAASAVRHRDFAGPHVKAAVAGACSAAASVPGGHTRGCGASVGLWSAQPTHRATGP